MRSKARKGFSRMEPGAMGQIAGGGERKELMGWRTGGRASSSEPLIRT